jgi:serine/threonine protein kinase
MDGGSIDEFPRLVVGFTIGPYRVFDTLGQGSFAAVYKAIHQVTQCLVAIKAIAKAKLCTFQEFELLQREVNLMKTLDHPFVVCFYEVLDDSANFYLVMELVPRGHLLNHITTNGYLDEATARRIFIQLMHSLDYLHSRKHIIHRDLKPENILLDEHMNIRVVDFGLSKAFSRLNPLLDTQCGSPAYVAPEIVREERYTCAADVWSAGVILFAMASGGLPFSGETTQMLLEAIVHDPLVIPEELSPPLRALLQGMLERDQTARLSVAAVLEHPWVADARLDAAALAELAVQDVESLDDAVIAEMRVLGYETKGLLNDVRACAVNSRTAVYKMLRRKRMTEIARPIVTRRMSTRPTALVHSVVSGPRRSSESSVISPTGKAVIVLPRVRKRTDFLVK